MFRGNVSLRRPWLAYPMLYHIREVVNMNKACRCKLHIKCIFAKIAQGKSCRWHWDHLLREFGRGVYRQTKGDIKCYT